MPGRSIFVFQMSSGFYSDLEQMDIFGPLEFSVHPVVQPVGVPGENFNVDAC